MSLEVGMFALLAACGSGSSASPAKATRYTTADLDVPLPAGYQDPTATMRAAIPGIAAAFEGPAHRGGERPVIVIQKAPLPGGVIDIAACVERGRRLVEDGPQLPGKPATLRSAVVITWARGPGCKYAYLTPDRVPTVLVELHDPANTTEHPVEIWSVICQHDDGDAAADAACRAVHEGLIAP